MLTQYQLHWHITGVTQKLSHETDSGCRQMDIALNSIVAELELTDFDADHRLLDCSGTSLLIFTSIGCASCRWARRELPKLALPIDRLCWIDAGENGGLVARYEVFHLPAVFIVRDGQFFGAVRSRLSTVDLVNVLGEALARSAEELP